MAINLLVVGRGGNGKSSSANSIFGKKVFQSSSHASANFEWNKAESDIQGRKVTVAEVSGLEYPSIDNSEDFENIFAAIEKEIRDCEHGFSAIIFVLKYGLRYTKQERDAIMIIKSTFGADVLKRYGVLVLTNGDSFDADMEEENLSFEDWCKSQAGDFCELLNESENRCVLFNNRTNDGQILENQREKLFAVVNNNIIRSQIGPYTITEYEEAESSRTVILVISKLPRLKSETTIVLAQIGENLKSLCDCMSLTLEEKTELENLLKELKKHQQYIQNEDKNTKILKSILLEMSLLEKRITLKLQIAGLLLIDENEWDKLEDVDSSITALTGNPSRKKHWDVGGLTAYVFSYLKELRIYQMFFHKENSPQNTNTVLGTEAEGSELTTM